MKEKFHGWFGIFELDPEIDFYGERYWERVATKRYEPDTMVFLENNIDSNTDFIDVGAATGAMSIVAASLGARVLAFEAVPRVYEIAASHLSNNPSLFEKITLRNEAISSSEGILEFGQNANAKVISGISNEDTNEKVKIVTLPHAIRGFHHKGRKLVIKIDIEGAEWELMSDRATLLKLKEAQALVLLAIHPGFDRPYRNLPLGLTFFAKKIWQIQNLWVAHIFFRRLFMNATLTRTSLDRINSPKKCILLMFGGYFEFVLDFGHQP